MKKLNQYIQEKFILNKNTKPIYNYYPKTREELIEILEERLKEDKNANLNDIDVSKVTDMNNLFVGLDPHNIDISKWKVSMDITNMSDMFNGCENFNSNLSKWDVSTVDDMNGMFSDCKRFNSDLSKWDVSNVEDMGYMFNGCENFNSDLSNWNVSEVKDMTYMFNECNSLKNKPSWYKE